MAGDAADSRLTLALLHWPVAHGEAEANRRELLRLNRRAAELGARVILNPEMALSGYGFDSRREIAPLVETADGPTLGALGALAREFGVYLALGLAERAKATGAYHNAAFLLGPDGVIRARRRKITAEAKWACPGTARQDDTCATPFGRLGLLICSETYFGLLPRIMALKGVDLLLVPANWPPGGLDPGRLWQSRAWENGFYLAACNRAGKDRRLDCSQARSHLRDPAGRELLPAEPAEPGIFLARLPLAAGRLAGVTRAARLAGRRPALYPYAAAQLNRIRDLAGFLGLPGPGRLQLHCLAGGEEAGRDPEALARRLAGLGPGRPGLAVLPRDWAVAAEAEVMLRLARESGLDIVCPGPRSGEPPRCYPADGAAPLWAEAGEEPAWLDRGPARVGVASAEELLHPELALALAKRGCDLVAASGGELGEEALAALGLRCLERLVVGVAGHGAALVAAPPRGHEPPELHRAGGEGAGSLELDTAQTRDKAYEELVDYPALLAAPGEARP